MDQVKVRKPRKKSQSSVEFIQVPIVAPTVVETTANTGVSTIVEEVIVHPKHENTISERVVDHLKGKYVKRQLVYLENNGLLTLSVRKVVLDTFNDFARELKKELGY